MEYRRRVSGVHFVGIGGIGMSALARYFLNRSVDRKLGRKWSISGSDAVRSPMTKELIKEGVNVKIGHKRAYVGPEVGLVIYNRAILRDNPELVEARRRKIPVVPYARVLGEITKGHTTIAITGSHGKTTTTALAGLLLMKNNFDPTIFVGSTLGELGGKNLRIGKSSYLVLEADDFGGAFLEYTSKIAIVTNIDREHLDFYKTLGNIKGAFMKFLSRTDPGGTIILNRDDKNLRSLRPKIFALAKKKEITIVWYSLHDAAAKKIKKHLQIPGEHNLSNALAVYALGRSLRIPEKNILKALGAYRGAWRRMEYRGSLKISEMKQTIRVFDDYAHHPTEIKATLQAFREKFPKSPLLCVFQPHQAKRLKALFKEFQTAFSEADATVILPLYTVKGRDKRTPYDAKRLAFAIKRSYPKKNIWYFTGSKKIKSFLRGVAAGYSASRSPIVIMMGAGDIVSLTDTLVS